jgi:hypothetical protein
MIKEGENLAFLAERLARLLLGHGLRGDEHFLERYRQVFPLPHPFEDLETEKRNCFERRPCALS